MNGLDFLVLGLMKSLIFPAALIWIIFGGCFPVVRSRKHVALSRGCPSPVLPPPQARATAVLTWKHGKSQAEAVADVGAAIEQSGYGGYVAWEGARAEARYGPFASVLHVKGEVTGDAVVLEKCGGPAGGVVLGKCRQMLERLFPGGGPS
jgi:hypothetical protein